MPLPLYASGMPLRRALASVLGALLVILVTVPLAAEASDSGNVGTTGAGVGTDTVLSIHDSTQDNVPAINIDGSIRATVSDAGPRSVASPTVGAGPATVYSLITAGGSEITLGGGIPASVRTGAHFHGSVAVPVRILAKLDAASARKLASATVSPLSQTSPAAHNALTVAASTTTPLPVAQADITLLPSGVVTPMEHTIDVVVPALSMTVPLDSVAYSDSKLINLSERSAQFWQLESSRNPNTMIPGFRVSPTITRYSSALTCASRIGDIWDQAAVHLGYRGAQDYLDHPPAGFVHHLAVFLPPQCSENNETGIGTVGSSVNSGGLIEDTLGLTVDTVTLAHEIGHNFSLGHSNVDYCDTDSVALGCPSYEYADIYDVMGASITGYDSPAYLSVRTMVTLGFQSPAATTQLALADPKVAQTFTAKLWDQLYPGADMTPTAIVVTDPINQEKYFLEYEMGWSGANTPYWVSGRILGLDGSGSRNLFVSPGVTLLRSTADNGVTVVSQPDDNNDYNDASISVGLGYQNSTVSNPSGSIRVTMAENGGGAGAQLSVTLTPIPTALPSPVYRFWSPTLQVHFYTISEQEKAGILARYPSSLWTYEGVGFNGFTSPVPGTVPLFRFWSPRLGDHFYTTNAAERDYIIGHYDLNTWRYEGVAYYVYPMATTVPNTLSIARFWSPRLQNHFYTANPTERDLVIRDYPDTTWSYEDDEFRVPAP